MFGSRGDSRSCRDYAQPALRQMVYLAIKELCPLADDTIMVTASIMKDMQPNMEVIYRPNAIRALSRVVDVSTSRERMAAGERTA